MTTKYDVKRDLKKCYSPKNTDWERTCAARISPPGVATPSGT